MRVEGGMDREDGSVSNARVRGLSLSHETEGAPALCDHVDGPRGILFHDVSQTEKDTRCVILLVCGP